jgi:hypothetical protein
MESHRGYRVAASVLIDEKIVMVRFMNNRVFVSAVMKKLI